MQQGRARKIQISAFTRDILFSRNIFNQTNNTLPGYTGRAKNDFNEGTNCEK